MTKNLLLLVVFWIIMLSLLCVGARAMDWTTANQVTVAWQPVATLENGQPIPDGSVIKYETVYVPENGSKINDLVVLGETIETEYVITFENEGRFFVGVRVIRVQGAVEVSRSIISWSDNPIAVKDGVTFGIVYFLVPGSVTGLEVLNNVGPY